MRDGIVRLLLTVIAAALVVLVLLEGGWLPRQAASPAGAAPPLGRYQYAPVRYGPLGNFLLRFDSATGKLERVRFPASDVVWEEVGVLPEGKKPRPDPARESLPPGQGVNIPSGPLTIGPGGILLPAPAPQSPPGGAGNP